MIYIFCCIAFGVLSSIVQNKLSLERLSLMWWAVGAPFWLLGGFVGVFLSNVQSLQEHIMGHVLPRRGDWNYYY